MFGDKEKYLDKFKTCARCREKDNQMLDNDFYCKEHTKPLFKVHEFMTVHNIYHYHCFMQILKILKLRTPISMFSKFTISKRKDTLLITPPPNTDFLYKSSILWNSLRIKLDIMDFSTNISLIKAKLKALILFNQHSLCEIDWSDENFVM